MSEANRFAPVNQLDIKQILLEAQHRWLRPPEICGILNNYQQFQISQEPPTLPPGGSLFLFDRKLLRYFRKDGHNWRKKTDGKTVKEAHERLKTGGVDVLHCYYARGEENENFQRRSYWLLEEELSHIVLVHYLEVKGNRTYVNHIQTAEESIPSYQETGQMVSSDVGGAASYSYHQNDPHMHSQTTDTSVNGAQTSENEDAESVYNNQASSGFQPYHELQQPTLEKIHAGFGHSSHPTSSPGGYQKELQTIPGIGFSINISDKCRDTNNAGLTFGSKKSIDSQSWEDILGSCGLGAEVLPSQASYPSSQEHEILGQMLSSNSCARQDISSQQQTMEKAQAYDFGSLKHPLDLDLDSDFAPHEQRMLKQDTASSSAMNEKPLYVSPLKQRFIDGPRSEEGFKKLDSFNRWMSKELGGGDELADANESYMHSTSGDYWGPIESENGVNDAKLQRNLHECVMSPSLSRDQLFSIMDFSPSWTFVGSEVKVLITGRFLKNKQEIENCKWSCMFGMVEVPAEILADGVLRCVTPTHEAGRVPFYVTCSNRLACSEVREFEYRSEQFQDFGKPEDDSSDNKNLQSRFIRLLCSSSVWPNSTSTTSVYEVSQLSSKISSLLEEDIEEGDNRDQMLKASSNLGDEFSPKKMKDKILEKFLKEKLHSWLLQKTAEGGKGPNVLDEGGQGVLHFAAALGCDWALEPTILAGVSVNFRDVNGWTALHWAAFCGRECTVGSLIALGAASGVLTDPIPDYPSGRTPADLASAKGHKGIAGYLAESSLRTHLSSLNLNDKSVDAAGNSGGEATHTADLRCESSLKDSLTAVCNATNAAARIYQAFRVQSFQRKQIKELSDEKFGMSNEDALSLVMVKTNKLGGRGDDSVHAAATRIQNKFRSYKGRKEYLITRQRIIKIQAHVRGYQVRKTHKKIIWSVGILEKVILRWRRKRTGLRGFKTDANDGMQETLSNEGDDDFFKEGRKQTEERLQKALARVKSMVQYPEARDQYRRLLKVVNDIQESKVEKALATPEETSYMDDDLIDLGALLDDDAWMTTDS